MKFTDDKAISFKKLLMLLGLNQKSFTSNVYLEDEADSSKPLSEAILSGALNKNRDLSDKWVNPLKNRLRLLIDSIEGDAKKKHQAEAIFSDVFSEPFISKDVNYRIGDPLPSDAAFYIRRPCDDAIDRAIEQQAQLVWVSGPVKSGVSSLLIQVAAKARVAGHHVVEINFSDDLVLPDEIDFSDYAVVEVIRALYAHLKLDETFFNNAFDEVCESGNSHALDHFLTQELKEIDSRCMSYEGRTSLICLADNIDKLLYSQIVSIEDLNKFVLMVSNRFKFLTSIHLFCVIPPLLIHQDQITSRTLSQGARIVVSVFTESELSQLFDKLTSMGNTQIKELGNTTMILEYFGGLPYLLHQLIVFPYGKDVFNLREALPLFNGSNEQPKFLDYAIDYLLKHELKDIEFKKLYSKPDEVLLTPKQTNILQAYNILHFGRVPDYLLNSSLQLK